MVVIMKQAVRQLVPSIAALAVLASLAACGSTGSSAATGDRPSVVTALYPLAFVAERVGGDDITLTDLAAPGVEPHDLELAPRQVGTIVNADLVVYLDGFAPAVDEAVVQNAPAQALDVGSLVTLMASAGDGGDNEGSGQDPHFWLDPTMLSQVAGGVADRLGQIDPAHADGYAQRADHVLDDLGRLDADYKAGLATCRIRTIVTAHAAFAYLSRRYGLEQLSVAGLQPDAEPSGARIAEVQRTINELGVTTVYFELLTSPDVVQSIAADLSLHTAALDPIESVDPASAEDYLTVMARNLETLQAGQVCE
jgi:zinc transport system substrate-binding protein